MSPFLPPPPAKVLLAFLELLSVYFHLHLSLPSSTLYTNPINPPCNIEVRSTEIQERVVVLGESAEGLDDPLLPTVPVEAHVDQEIWGERH